jgi:hypothetical protein
MYTDFPITSSSKTLQKFETVVGEEIDNNIISGSQCVTALSRSAAINSTAPNSGTGIESQTLSSNRNVSSSLSGLFQQNTEQSSNENDSQDKLQSLSKSTPISPVFGFPRKRFFELCVNITSSHSRLGEIALTRFQNGIIHEINNDAEFFELIHDEYFGLQRPKWRGWIYKPVDNQVCLLSRLCRRSNWYL